ncbi:rod shape-determining protein MreC [Crassaminicella thermophila]|uniref:Cell shape-determining protein MreC n=2 Tax=Crassaminicella thermophila TaxID=2599308 RepID=A0A5C0SEV5_CRATE|nr:rod shape-determining protein MreC [Crassaminicella thermophila]
MKKMIRRGGMMIVTFVTIILIITIGITIGGRARVSMPENLIGKVITPVQKVLYKSGQGIEEAIRSLFKFRSIAKENKLLKKEVQDLNQKLIELSLTKDELNELRHLQDALNYVKENNKRNYITANVTGKDTGNWFNIFTIDVGKKHGIIKNSTVLNGDGLIGRVYEVGDNWSKVVTIIDNKSSVSFQVLRSNQYIGVIRGSVKADLTGYLIDPEAEVLVGDKLITSGLSMFEKGILIGEVKEVIKKKDELLKTIIVKPAVNFKKIDKVFIIIPEKLS